MGRTIYIFHNNHVAAPYIRHPLYLCQSRNYPHIPSGQAQTRWQRQLLRKLAVALDGAFVLTALKAVVLDNRFDFGLELATDM